MYNNKNITFSYILIYILAIKKDDLQSLCECKNDKYYKKQERLLTFFIEANASIRNASKSSCKTRKTSYYQYHDYLYKCQNK